MKAFVFVIEICFVRLRRYNLPNLGSSHNLPNPSRSSGMLSGAVVMFLTSKFLFGVTEVHFFRLRRHNLPNLGFPITYLIFSRSLRKMLHPDANQDFNFIRPYSPYVNKTPPLIKTTGSRLVWEFGIIKPTTQKIFRRAKRAGKFFGPFWAFYKGKTLKNDHFGGVQKIDVNKTHHPEIAPKSWNNKTHRLEIGSDRPGSDLKGGVLLT